MAFTKYQKSESMDILDSQQEEQVKTYLAKVGKKTVADLTDEEKAELVALVGN